MIELMNIDELDDFYYNDLDDDYLLETEGGMIPLYNDNGIAISISVDYDFYALFTAKYSITWSIYDTLCIYKDHNKLLEFKKDFDISYFAIADTKFMVENIKYSSAELVDEKIDKLLNLKAFI